MKSLNFTRNIFSILVLAFTFLLVGSVEGQVLLTDDFNYSGVLTSNSWIAHNGAGSMAISTTNGLSYSGYLGSGQGNAALIGNASGEDVNRTFNSQNIDGNSLYLAFLVNVTEPATSKTGDYFLHIGSPGGASWSTFSGRVFVKITSGNVNFGLCNTSTSASITYGTTNFSKNTTYLMVLKYTLSTGTSNDPLSLWVIPSGVPSTEGIAGSPEVIHNTTNGTDAINAVGLRQGSSSTSVKVIVDGIRVGNSWSDAVASCNTGNWIGSSTGNWNTASNWCGGVPASGSNLTISAGTTVTLDGTNEVTVGDLTINATGSLILPSNAKLTVTGNLVNNGTMTIESGATLDQTTNSSAISGTGTYIVKQALPTNRYWYLGVPIGAYTEASFLSNLTNGETLKKRDEAGNQWVTVTSNSTAIPAGRGYYVQNPTSTPTITFQGTGASSAFNNGAITTENLTSSGSGFQGFNLVSNPYPSYIDWTTVTKTNIGGTMWYRTHDGSGMNFGTVNGSGVGTTLNGTLVLTRYIPPMQSFWVRVATYGQPASLTFNNSNRSHFISENSSVAGLKSSNDSPSVFIRMNLKQAEKMDQLIVYTEDQATNGLDHLDADKMMQANYPQFYTNVGGKKIVINALNASKKQQSLPITMELPTTGVHSFMIEDLEISNGLVWLEDKQEEIIQALEPGTVYEFYANSGMNAERFVLHFQLIDDAVPTNVYNEVNSSANFSGKGASVYAESAGVVVIKLPASAEGVTDIQIRDAAGKLVYAGSMNNLETSVELAQANGIYYVTLSSNTGVEVRKVFIQQ